MIHMTPIQELGESRSAYSLYDVHTISNDIFPGQKLHEEDKFNIISKLFTKAENEIGILTLGDLVLNHTANNSPWLSSHPEATYNEITAPHLRPAIDLDLVRLFLGNNKIHKN
jgi:glycogen debranching enzyme